MQNDNVNTHRLEERLKELEREKAATLLALKHELSEAGESIKPANLIKNSIEEITESKQFKKFLIVGAAGLATALIAKKLLSKKGDKPQPLSRFLLETIITIALSNQFATLRNAGMNAIQEFVIDFLSKKEPVKEEEDDDVREHA